MSTEHNWPEDFSHENGNYNNDCYMCKTVFIGHKRRHVCRVCATPKSIRDQLAHLQSQLDECRRDGGPGGVCSSGGCDQMTPKQADNAATAERETAQLREERDEARAQRDANAESIAFVKEGRDQQLGELQRRINELNGIRIRVVDERDEYAARLTAAEATVAQLRAENEQLRSARVSSPGEIPGGVVTSPTALHQLTTLRSWPVVVSP